MTAGSGLFPFLSQRGVRGHSVFLMRALGKAKPTVFAAP